MLIEDLTPMAKLDKDLLNSAKTINAKQARDLVYSYYMLQEHRMATSSQARTLEEFERPNSLIGWMSDQLDGLEEQIKKALKKFADASPLGQWAQSICGIGPVMTAGLVAYIDIEQCPTVGHIWRYAGLDPTREWISREKAEGIYKTIVPKGTADNDQMIAIAKAMNIHPNLVTKAYAERTTRSEQISYISRKPFNGDFKVLCWKISKSFVMANGSAKDVYGKVYAIRKAYEEAKNEAGDYKDQAAVGAARVSKSTEAYKSYSIGKLPKGHLDARAKRYAVKMFLSHFHAVAYELHFGTKPPKPFAIAILNHAHEIPIPNWPMPVVEKKKRTCTKKAG